MALIECYECKEKVSQQAETCPHCGYPLKPKKEKGEYCLTTAPTGECRVEGLLALLALIVWIIGAIGAVACGIVYKSILAFLIAAISALLSGFAIWCMSELFTYLYGIYAKLSTLQLEEKPQKK